MVAVVSAVVGLVVGVLAALAWTQRRIQSTRDELATARATLAVRESELAGAREAAERERLDHDRAMADSESQFESLSRRVLAQTVEAFNQSQVDIQRERDARLDTTLQPLREALDAYQRNLSTFDKEHVGALAAVRQSATELLESQLRTQAETQRLNQLLGRSSQRGHWGEVQLANVLRASGLAEGLDFEMQVSAVSDAGRMRRPDCVVTLPNGRVAIDAKFPFDRFEEAVSAAEPEIREALYREHAQALRGHVKTLREKSYWEVVSPSPEFVVCFVPSDAAVTAAFSVDAELHAYATRERVLIAGPTNLLALLWSVQMVLRQHEVAVNAEEILRVAETIYDRIRVVAGPIESVGKALNDATRAYNKMISSVESRLIPVARSMRRLRVAPSAKPVPDLAEVTTLAAGLDPERWGIDPSASPDLEVLEVFELEGDDLESTEFETEDEQS
ncbi:MAG: DNA recombination protein RmuC [Actinomycetales bacterium]|nr:DNA recombination protein RmuC [Actinomycetales bacterium]